VFDSGKYINFASKVRSYPSGAYRLRLVGTPPRQTWVCFPVTNALAYFSRSENYKLKNVLKIFFAEVLKIPRAELFYDLFRRLISSALSCIYTSISAVRFYYILTLKTHQSLTLRLTAFGRVGLDFRILKRDAKSRC
jgi:hypothetical protein